MTLRQPSKMRTITPADYHNTTSYERLGMTGHALDWQNQPNVYKNYPYSEKIKLPEKGSLPFISLNDCILKTSSTATSGTLYLDTLTKLFSLAYSHTAERHSNGMSFFFRSAASAGALYPVEIYLAARSVSGLDAGLYHYNLKEFSLERLRGEEAAVLSEHLLPGDTQTTIPLTLYLTGIWFRSAWKYRNRAYRYVLLDTGHVLENLNLALKSMELSFSIHYNFDDRTLNSFLSVDADHEACLACINIHENKMGMSDKTEGPPDNIIFRGSDVPDYETISGNEIIYEDIINIHTAGMEHVLTTNEIQTVSKGTDLKAENCFNIENIDAHIPELDFAQAVLNRRSRRNFYQSTLAKEKFIKLLDIVTASSGGQDYPESISTGILTGKIEGIKPGFYLIDHINRRADLVDGGSMTRIMASVCLDQQWLENAAIHFLFMADFKELNRKWGARGYRYAMMTAGRIGQAVYLGAEALGLGCCGIGALYDNDARNVLDLNDHSALLYLVAAGPVKGKEA